MMMKARGMMMISMILIGMMGMITIIDSILIIIYLSHYLTQLQSFDTNKKLYSQRQNTYRCSQNLPCFNSLSFRFGAKICVMDGLSAACSSLTTGHFEWIQVEVRTCQEYWDQWARLMTPSEDCLGMCEEKWGLVRTREVGWRLVRWGGISEVIWLT